MQQPLPAFCSSFAGVRCQGSNIELKLVDSLYSGAGIVVGRVRPSDEWGAICGPADERDEEVVCRQLGFLRSVQVFGSVKNAHEIPETVLVSRPGCFGNETELSQCALVPGFGKTCNSYLYVECQEETARFDTPAYLCGEIHYCGYECNQGKRNTLRPIKEETCKCDEACVFFNDCCYDYHSICNQTSEWGKVVMNGVRIQYYTCMLTPGQPGHFGWAFVSLCPKTWVVPFVKQNCEMMSANDDVIGSLPVYDNRGAVYKNIFCAICHGVQPEILRKWNASIEFTQSSGSTTFDSRFNVTIEGTPTGRYVFNPPTNNDLFGTARTCPTRTVSSCSAQFSNTSVESACSDYFAPVYLNDTQFKNPHCAMCNGLTVDPTDGCGPLCNMICSKENVWAECSAVCAPSGVFPTIETLFDFGWGGGDDSVCRTGELFDPFLERCRAVFCPSGVANEDGKCTEVSDVFHEKSSLCFGMLNENCTTFLNTSLHADTVYWRAEIDSEIENFQSTGLEIVLRDFDSIEKRGEELFMMLEKYLSDLQMCNIGRVAVYVTTPAVLLEIESCANTSLEAGDVFQISEQNSSQLDFEIFPTYLWTSHHGENFVKEEAAPSECLEILELKCMDSLLLSPGEYERGPADASFIKHTSTGLKFDTHEFALLSDGRAAICGPVEWTDPNVIALWIVSLVCSFLSLSALVATFVTYWKFPELRNMAGMYTMNLVVALFVAILLVALAGFLSLEGHNCVLFGALTHFSWLSAFFWMAMLSYNVARTFSGGISSTGARRKSRRLLVCMLLAWGGALLIVSTCLSLTLCECTGLPPVYSHASPCLFTSGTVLLGVFGAPVVISLLFNTICFIVVIVSVRKTKCASKMVQNKGQMKEALDEVKIYAKLSSLFGLTWVLAFISEAVGQVFLSYVNVLINTLQGVFVFVVFCLNQRVRALWRREFRDHRGGESSGQLQLSTMRTSRSSKTTQLHEDGLNGEPSSKT